VGTARVAIVARRPQALPARAGSASGDAAGLVVAAGDLESRLRRIATGYESELRFVHDSIIPSATFIDDVAAFEALKCGTRLHITA